jgi:1,5-anhydro-D-fructose reductase (1,5-anhydro-D-mannitol-forming)
MVRWLVIGIGDIARRRVIPAILAEPRSRLQALLTRDPQKATAYPGVEVFTNLDVALQIAPIDAVYVASPVALHAPQAIACLQAGKHVLSEKPTAINLAAAQSMVAAARAHQRLFAVAYYRRLFPKLFRARQLIAEGVIGQPLLAEANCHEWRSNDSPDQTRSWLFDPTMAGAGPLFDIACHRIDAINFLFGEPARSTGLLSNAVHQAPVEDSATVLIQYPPGIHATVDVRWNSRIERDQFRVIGTDAEINLDPLGGPILRIGSREESLPPHDNIHYPCVENFVSAILDGAPLACPGEQALWTDRVLQTVLSANQK